MTLSLWSLVKVSNSSGASMVVCSLTHALSNYSHVTRVNVERVVAIEWFSESDVKKGIAPSKQR